MKSSIISGLLRFIFERMLQIHVSGLVGKTKCPVCGSSFRDEVNLRRHLRMSEDVQHEKYLFEIIR